MKNLVVIFLIIVLIMTSIGTVFANSGPIYMEQVPAYEILMLEDCPIIVESENLSFHISETEYYGWSPKANVTAAYQMKNPTDSEQTVKMAFSFIWSPNNNQYNETNITVNGGEVFYTMLIGQDLSGQNFHDDPEVFYQATDMQNVLESMVAPPYSPRTFDDQLEATIYSLTIGNKYEDVNIIVSFTIDTNTTKIITNRFNGFTVQDNNLEISTWVYQNSERFMMSEGQGISYAITDSQLYGIATHYLDTIFGLGQMITTFDDMWSSLLSSSFMAILIYEVNFPPKSVTEVVVSYPMGATMDRRNSAYEAYTYAYVLNPARGYADFGELNIKIVPPSHLPYIVTSSTFLEHQENGSYTAVYDGLPENDLVFTLYSSPVINSSNDKEKNISLPYIITGTLAIAVIFTILVILSRKIYQKKKGDL